MKSMKKLALLSLSLAATLGLPSLAAAQTTGTCGTPAASLNRTWSKSDDFGGENFGASYSASATLVGSRDGLDIKGNLTADASIFGNNQNIVKADVAASAAVVGRSASENIDVFVMGKNIFHHSRSSGTGSGAGINFNFAKKWDVTFFRAEKRFFFGPVPVKVKATATGSAGVTLDSAIGIFAVNATAKPSANAYATASASLDIAVAEAGVQGRLTMIEAGVPTVGELLVTTAPGISYKINSDLNLHYLDGVLNVFYKLIFGKRHEKKIADWSGTTRNFPIANESGCIKFL